MRDTHAERLSKNSYRVKIIKKGDQWDVPPLSAVSLTLKNVRFYIFVAIAVLFFWTTDSSKRSAVQSESTTRLPVVKLASVDRLEMNLTEETTVDKVEETVETIAPVPLPQEEVLASEGVKSPLPVEVLPSVGAQEETDPKLLARTTLEEIGQGEYWYAVDYIFTHESTWNPSAENQIGCVGLGQSCPGGSGLVADCPNYQTDVACQVRHFTNYANRYGGWSGAYSFWLDNHWW